MKNRIIYVALGVIVFAGFFLRNYNLTVWPREGATFDEYAWVFQGLSLWQTGTPTSWSPHAEYAHRVEYYNPQGAHFTLVTPYLEHPPLFGLIAGGYAKLAGITSFDGVRTAPIRPLALALGVISILAVFLLANSVSGSVVGLLSALFYAVTPTVVAGSRIVQNENFFIPFFLLSLYFAYRYLEHGTKAYLYIALVISGLLPLAKIPWIAAPLAVTAMFLYKKKRKEAWLTIAAAAIGIAVYMAYGIYFDKTVFFNLWSLQLARYDMSFNSLFMIFQNPMVTDRTFVDGWLYIGWAAFALFMTKDLKKTYPVLFGFIAYLFIFLAAIPGEPGHGWYRYPFYPFLLIGMAATAYTYFVKNRILTFTALSAIGLSLFEYTWKPIFGFSYFVLRGYLVLCAMTTLPLIWKNQKIERYATVLSYVLAILILVLSCWSGLAYNEQ